MYKKLLKDESDRILFQYIEDFNQTIKFKNMSIDEYLKDIEIDIEIQETYEYHSLLINNHHKKPLLSENGETELNYEAFYKDFYNAIKESFRAEIQKEYDECKEALDENHEDLKYFENYEDKGDLYFSVTDPVSDEERESLIQSYKREIKVLNKKMSVLSKMI